MTRKFMIAIPTYTGLVAVECMVSVLGLCQKLGNVGIEYEIVTRNYDGNIARARNALCHHFLESDCTHMLFVDDDMTFHSGHIFQMLVATDYNGIIGALCPRKNMSTGNGVYDCYQPRKPRAEKTDTLYEAYRVGTGIMLIPRQVLEQLDVGVIDGHKTFFEFVTVANQGYLSEDYYFCDLVHNAGFGVAVAMWTDVSHMGRYCYK